MDPGAITSAAIILGAALLGGPASTTQVASSAFMGAGAAERASKIQWTVACDIAMARALTIPVSALLAAGLSDGRSVSPEGAAPWD